MTTSFVGHKVLAVTVPVRRQPFRLPLLLLIPWWLLKLLVKLLLVIAGSPVAVTILTLATLSWAAWRLAGPLLSPRPPGRRACGPGPDQHPESM
jgi:hypothetical protein